jgi:hypothetical protein
MLKLLITKIYENLEKQCKDDQRLNMGKLKRSLSCAGAAGVCVFSVCVRVSCISIVMIMNGVLITVGCIFVI